MMSVLSFRCKMFMAVAGPVAAQSERAERCVARLMSNRVRLNCTQHSYSAAIYFIFACDRALLSVFLSYCLRGSIIPVLLLANETHRERVGFVRS